MSRKHATAPTGDTQEIDLVGDPTNTAKQEDALPYVTKDGLAAYLGKRIADEQAAFDECVNWRKRLADSTATDYYDHNHEEAVRNATQGLQGSTTKLGLLKEMLNVLPFLQADGSVKY